jgi:hypothetical protein
MSQRKDQAPEMDTELQAHIGRHLKAAYEDILSQDVPDRFLQLLQALETSETGPNGKNEPQSGSR